MPQPFWEVELAKQHGKLINAAMDYSPESRTAPVFVMPRTASGWQPPPMVRPAQTFTPASRSVPIVFRHPPVAAQSVRMGPPAWQQTGTVRAPARTASCAEAGDALDRVRLDPGTQRKSLQHPPGWLAGVLIVIAGYVGNQLRHHEAPPAHSGARSHAVSAPTQSSHRAQR